MLSLNQSTKLVLQSEDFIDGSIIAVPNWNLAIISQLEDSKTVEVPLILSNKNCFATEESSRAYKETGDRRFLDSRTIMVIEIKESETIGFIVTIVPDKEYFIANDFDVFNSTYKKW